MTPEDKESPIINHSKWKKSLDEFINVLNKNKIRYWLDGGVLLGAVREKDFINGDTDIDLGIFESDLTRANYEQLKDDLDDLNWAQRRGERNHVNSFKNENGLQIEIWRFDLYNKDWYYHKGWDGIFLFPADCLNTLDTLNFLGTDYNVPHNPEKYLENLYGVDWQTPKSMKKPYDYPAYFPNDLIKPRPVEFNHKDFFFELLNILDQNKIPYFIFCGTLLGAVRQNNFLPGDINDTDIAIDDSYYWSVRKIFDKYMIEHPEFYYKSIWRKEFTIGQKGVKFKLDIFFMEKNENNYYIYSYKQNSITNKWDTEWRARFNYNLFYPLLKRTFLGREISIPNKFNEILEAHYGKTWKIPNPKHVVGSMQDIDKAYIPPKPDGIIGPIIQNNSINKTIGFMCVNFLRKESTKKCISSLKIHAPYVKVYIADQDEPSGEMIRFYEENNVEYYFVKKDIGLSWCRNFLIDKVQEPYLMWGDNDFIFEEKNNMPYALIILKNKPEIGFVGGAVISNGKVWHYERLLTYRPEYGILIYLPLEFTNPEPRIIENIKYYHCDLTFNYTICRTEELKNNKKLRWNDKVKVRYEHSDFFLRINQFSDLKVVYCPDMTVIHAHDKTNVEYNSYRGRKNDGIEFARFWNLKINFTVGSGKEEYETGKIFTAKELDILRQTLTEKNFYIDLK